MKISIKIFSAILILLLFKSFDSLCNISDLAPGELLIYNRSSENIKIVVYPIGAIFNGNLKYSLQSILYENRKITGGQKVLSTIGSSFTLDHDGIGDDGADSSIGYGKYRIVFYKLVNSNYDSVDYCDIDYSDADFPYSSFLIADIALNYYNQDSITCDWNSKRISQNRLIQIWDQRIRSPNAIKQQNKNGFTSSVDFTNYPINATGFGAVAHISPGDLSVYLNIDDDIDINTGFDFTMKKNSYLQLSPGKIIDFMTVSGLYPKMIVQDSAFLKLGTGSKLIVEAQNMLSLKNKSNLILMSNSEIRFKAGSFFCKEGARIVGNATASIIFEKGYHQINCYAIYDYLFEDSIKIILEDSAIVEIPDSTVFHLSGINTTMILNPNSKIKMGVNSKLLFDSSATIIAKGATFTSLDSTGKWEGIVLQNSGSDTISNCTFTNAKTSLAFLNSPGHTFTTRVVKNNVFNIPSGSDNTGIYGENNFRITIQDNAFNMPANPSSKIFGVFLKNSNTEGVESLPEENEPAPAYRMFLINNTFNNGTASMMLLNYTSSYIPFYVKGNICNSASSVAIVGRNLTGTFKDNIISYTGSLIPMGIHLIASSPDFYKNTITSEEVSLHKIGSSYPDLEPAIDGIIKIWKAGIDIICKSKEEYLN